MSSLKYYSLIFSIIIGTVMGLEQDYLMVLFIPLLISAVIFHRIFPFVLIMCLLIGIYFGSQKEILDLNIEGVVEGIVTEEVDKRQDKNIYTVSITENIKARVFTDINTVFNYGDEIMVDGKAKRPENFSNENDVEFNYVKFLEKDDIYFEYYYPKVELLSSGHGNFFKENILNFKKIVVLRMGNILPSPHSDLLAGLILGAKNSMSRDWLVKFRDVGLIHIVVLSGYNVTLISDFVRRSFIFFPKHISALLSILFIIIFVIMVGAGPSIVRAGIMAILGVISQTFYRAYSINRALFLSAVIMILLNPKILLYDPGFQLSFVATLGLVHLAPQVKKLLIFITEKFQMREIVASTIGTQISVTPLLINMTGEISIISLVANIIVLPVISLTMLVGFINLLINNILVTSTSYMLLEYVFTVVDFLSGFRFATVRI